MAKMVIYDMDKTITRRATYTAFLVHIALKVAPWRFVLAPLSAVFGLGYLLKIVSRSRLKELNQIVFIGGIMPLAKLQPHIESYADKVLAKNIRPGALRQIAADKAAGCQLMMATASYELYVEAIAQRLGFDVVLGTRLVIENGYVRAKIDGENCYAEAKVNRIKAWQAEQSEPVTIARTYSDHVSDVPMLLLGEEPIAVNPHLALRRHAKREQWSVQDWNR